MSEECCYCHRYLPNSFFPLYKKYMNNVHQPCKDCWKRLNEKERKQTIKQLDEFLKEVDRVRLGSESR